MVGKLVDWKVAQRVETKAVRMAARMAVQMVAMLGLNSVDCSVQRRVGLLVEQKDASKVAAMVG